MICNLYRRMKYIHQIKRQETCWNSHSIRENVAGSRSSIFSFSIYRFIILKVGHVILTGKSCIQQWEEAFESLSNWNNTLYWLWIKALPKYTSTDWLRLKHLAHGPIIIQNISRSSAPTTWHFARTLLLGWIWELGGPVWRCGAAVECIVRIFEWFSK